MKWLKRLGMFCLGMGMLAYAGFRTADLVNPSVWESWNDLGEWLPILNVMLVNALFPLAIGLFVGIRIAPLIRMTMSEKMKRLSQWSVIAILFGFIGMGLTTGAVDIDAQRVGLTQLQARFIGLVVGATSIIFLLVVAWIMMREARIVDETDL